MQRTEEPPSSAGGSDGAWCLNLVRVELIPTRHARTRLPDPPHHRPHPKEAAARLTRSQPRGKNRRQDIASSAASAAPYWLPQDAQAPVPATYINFYSVVEPQKARAPARGQDADAHQRDYPQYDPARRRHERRRAHAPPAAAVPTLGHRQPVVLWAALIDRAGRRVGPSAPPAAFLQSLANTKG